MEDEEQPEQDSMDEGDYTMAVVGLAREFEKHDNDGNSHKKDKTTSLEQTLHAYTPSKPNRQQQQQQHLTNREDAMVSIQDKTEEELSHQPGQHHQDNATEALEFALEQHEMQLLRQTEDLQDPTEMVQPESFSLGRRQGQPQAPRSASADQTIAPADYRGYLLANQNNNNRDSLNLKSSLDSQDGPVAFSLDDLASLGSGASSPQDTKQEDIPSMPAYMSPGRDSQSAVDYLRQELSHTLESELEAFQNVSDPIGQSQSEEESNETPPEDPYVIAKVHDVSSAAGDPSLLMISSSSDGSSPSQNSSIKNMAGERVTKNEPSQLLASNNYCTTEGKSVETSRKSSICSITEAQIDKNVEAEAEKKDLGKKEENEEINILAAFRTRVVSQESADKSDSLSISDHKELSVEKYDSVSAKSRDDVSLVNDVDTAASCNIISATKSIASAASLEEDESLCLEIDGLSIAATKGGYATDTGYATDAAVDTVTHDGYNTEGGTVRSSMKGDRDALTVDSSAAVVPQTTKFSRAAARGRRRGRRRQIRNEQQKAIENIRHGMNTSHDSSLSASGTPQRVSGSTEVESSGETITESCVKAATKNHPYSPSRRLLDHKIPADYCSDTSVTSRNTVSKMRQMFERGASLGPSNPGTPKSKASASDIRKMRQRAKSQDARCKSSSSGAGDVVDFLSSKQAKTVLSSKNEGYARHKVSKSFDLNSSAKKEAASIVHSYPTVLPTQKNVHDEDFKNAENHNESNTTGSSDNDTLAPLSDILKADATLHLQQNRNKSGFNRGEGTNKERPKVALKAFGGTTPTKGPPTRVSESTPYKSPALSKGATPTKGDSLCMSTSASLGDRSFFTVHEDTSLFGTAFSTPVTPSPKRPHEERPDEQLKLPPSSVNHNLSPCKTTTNTKTGGSQYHSKTPESTPKLQTAVARSVSTFEASKLDTFFLKSKIGKEKSAPAQVYHHQEAVSDFILNGSLAGKEQESFSMSVGPGFTCEISDILEESSKAGSSRDRIERSEEKSLKLIAGVSNESFPSSGGEFSKLFESNNSTNTDEFEKNDASGSQTQAAPPNMAGSSQSQEEEGEENDPVDPGEQVKETVEAVNLPAEDHEQLALIAKVQDNPVSCVEAKDTSQMELSDTVKEQNEEGGGLTLVPLGLEEQEPSEDTTKLCKVTSGKEVDDDTAFEDLMDELENSAVVGGPSSVLEDNTEKENLQTMLDDFFGDFNDFDGDLCSTTAGQASGHLEASAQRENTQAAADVPALDWEVVLDDLLTDIVAGDDEVYGIIAHGPPNTLTLKEASSLLDDPSVGAQEDEQLPALEVKTLGNGTRNELDETGSLNDDELCPEDEVLARSRENTSATDAGKECDDAESLKDDVLSPKNKVPPGLEEQNGGGGGGGGSGGDNAVIEPGKEFDESVSQIKTEPAEIVEKQIDSAANAPAGVLSKKAAPLSSGEALAIDDTDASNSDALSDHDLHPSYSFAAVSSLAVEPQSPKPSDTPAEKTAMNEEDDDHSVTDTSEAGNATLDSSLLKPSIEPSNDAVADNLCTGERNEATTEEDNQRICNSRPRSEGMNNPALRPFQSEPWGDECVAPFDETESKKAPSVLSGNSSNLPCTATGKDAEEVFSIPQLSSAPMFASVDTSKCSDSVQATEASEKLVEDDCEIASQHCDAPPLNEENEGKEFIKINSDADSQCLETSLPMVPSKEAENSDSKSGGTSPCLTLLLANEDTECVMYDLDHSPQHRDVSSPPMEASEEKNLELPTVLDAGSVAGSHLNASNILYGSETYEFECPEPEDNQYSGSVANSSIADTSSGQHQNPEDIEYVQDEYADGKESPGFQSGTIDSYIADTSMKVHESGINQEPTNNAEDEDYDEVSPDLESSAIYSVAEAFTEVDDGERGEQLEPNGRLVEDDILESDESEVCQPDPPELATLCDREDSYAAPAAEDEVASHQDTHTAAESQENESTVDLVAVAVNISVADEEACLATDVAADADADANVTDEEHPLLPEQDYHSAAESDSKSASIVDSNIIQKPEAGSPNVEDGISAEVLPVAASVDNAASDSLEVYLANALDENVEHALRHHTADSGEVADATSEVGSEDYSAASPSVSLHVSFPPDSSVYDPDASNSDQDFGIGPILGSDGSVASESDGQEVNLENHNTEVSNEDSSCRDESSLNGNSRIYQASSLGISHEDDTVSQQQEPPGYATHELYREVSCNQGEDGHEEVEVPFISAKNDACDDQRKEIQSFMEESLDVQERIRALQEIVSGAGSEEDTLPEESRGDENISAHPEITACYSADQSDHSDQSATSAGASAWSDTDDESFINQVLRATDGQDSARPSGDMETGNIDTNTAVTNDVAMLSESPTFESEENNTADRPRAAVSDEPISEAHSPEIEMSESWDECANEPEAMRPLSMSRDSEEHSVHPSDVDGIAPESLEVGETSLGLRDKGNVDLSILSAECSNEEDTQGPTKNRDVSGGESGIPGLSESDGHSIDELPTQDHKETYISDTVKHVDLAETRQPDYGAVTEVFGDTSKPAIVSDASDSNADLAASPLRLQDENDDSGIVARVSPSHSPVSAYLGVANSAEHEASPEGPAPGQTMYSHDFFSDSAFLVADASFRQQATVESIHVARVHRNQIDEHHKSPLCITEEAEESPDASVEASPPTKMAPQQAAVEDDDTDDEVEELLQDLVEFKRRVRRPSATEESDFAAEEVRSESEDTPNVSSESGNSKQPGSQDISANQGRTPFEEELRRLKAELSSKRGQSDSSALGLQRTLSTPKLSSAKHALDDSNDSSKDSSNDDADRVRELLKQAFRSKRSGSHEYLTQAKRSYSYSYGDNLEGVDGENVKPLGNDDLQGFPDDNPPNGESVNQSCSSREDNSFSRTKLQPSGSKMELTEEEPAESRPLHPWHAEDARTENFDGDKAASDAQPTLARGGDPGGAASVSTAKEDPPERPHLLDGMKPTRFRSRLASTPDAVYAQLVKKAALLAQLQRLSNPTDHLLSVETRIRKYEGFFEGASIPSAIEGTEGSPHYHIQNDHNFNGEEYCNDDDSESLSLVYSVDASISLSSTIKTEDTYYNHFLAGPPNYANDSRNSASREIGSFTAEHNLGTINESFASEKLNDMEEEELPKEIVSGNQQNGIGAEVFVETVDDEENMRSSGCLDEETAATAVTMFKTSNSVSEIPVSGPNQDCPSNPTAQVVGSEYADTPNLSGSTNGSIDFDENSILESKPPLPKNTAPAIFSPVTTSDGIVALGTPIKDEAIPVEAALTGIRELVAETFTGFRNFPALFEEDISPPQLEEEPMDGNNTSSYSNPEFFSVECTLSVYGNQHDEQSEYSGNPSLSGNTESHSPISTGLQQREAVSLLKTVQEQDQTRVEPTPRESANNMPVAARMQTKESGMPAATSRSTSRLPPRGRFPLDTFEFKPKKSKKKKGSDDDSSQISSVQDPSVFSSAYLPPRPDHLDDDDYGYQDDYYTI